MRPARLRLLLTSIAALSAMACAWMSQLDFAPVKAFIDGKSADGAVESYTEAFHARVQHHLLLAALGAGLVVLLLVLFRRMIDRSLARVAMDARSFRGDLAAWWSRSRRSMDRTEVILVLSLMAWGAVLRCMLLTAPVIYDEAFTCTYYAVRPAHIIIAEYSYPNNHILHTLLVKFSMALFGWGEVQARLPALLAGLAVLPLFWLCMRRSFGRSAALFALALAAVSGPLVEYSALARGYSITWVMMSSGLLLADHLVRKGNAFSALMLAVVNALGMWAVPTMLYASVMVYLLALWQVRSTPVIDGARPMRMILISGGTFIVLTLLLYAPVLVVYGASHLLHHDTMGPNSWSHFTGSLIKKLNETWQHFTLESPWAWGLILVVGAVAGGVIAREYRKLLAVLFLSIVPMVVAQHMLAPPRVWIWVVFILLAGAGIALGTLSDRLITAPRWAPRTIIISLLAVGLGMAVMRDRAPRANRFGEARETVTFLRQEMAPDDRLIVYVMWQSPIEFYLIKEGLGNAPLYREPRPGAGLWMVVGTNDGEWLDEVTRHAGLAPGSYTEPRKVKVQERSMIFAARIH